MGMLSAAVGGERWEEVALCLLVGLLQVAASIPEDALAGLLEALEGKDNAAE